MSRKGGMKGSAGVKVGNLVEKLRYCVNERRNDEELRALSAPEAEHKLLLRWDSNPVSKYIFEQNIASSSSVVESEPISTAVDSGAGSVQDGLSPAAGQNDGVS
eukprot:2615317-Pleurochrysis_carterae.AAC.1